MATSIGVKESTRDALEQVKREFTTPSIDATLQLLLKEHEELKGRRASGVLLRRVSERRKEIATFASKHGLSWLAAFGSAIHGDARPDSDLDLVVRFQARRQPSLLGLVAIERQLGEILGVTVDLHPAGSLNEFIRDRVLAEAFEIYVAA